METPLEIGAGIVGAIILLVIQLRYAVLAEDEIEEFKLSKEEERRRKQRLWMSGVIIFLLALAAHYWLDAPIWAAIGFVIVGWQVYSLEEDVQIRFRKLYTCIENKLQNVDDRTDRFEGDQGHGRRLGIVGRLDQIQAVLDKIVERRE